MQERPLSHASSLTPSSSTASSTTSFFPSISDPPTSSSSPSSSSAPFHMILCSFPPSNASGSSTSCSSHHLLSPSRLLQGTRNFQISAIFLVLILLNAFPVRDVCYMILLTYQQVLLLLVTEHFFAEGRVTLQNWHQYLSLKIINACLNSYQRHQNKIFHVPRHKVSKYLSNTSRLTLFPPFPPSPRPPQPGAPPLFPASPLLFAQCTPGSKGPSSRLFPTRCLTTIFSRSGRSHRPTPGPGHLSPQRRRKGWRRRRQPGRAGITTS